jgi:Tol biopolymer transport system component
LGRHEGRRARTRFAPFICVVIAALALAAPAGATFPGSNGPIAFEDLSAGVDLVDPDGSGRRTLALGTQPSFSADGETVVFQRTALFLIGADGSGLRQIGPSGTQIFEPAFSPDGRTIVFYGTGGLPLDSFQILAMDSDGTDVRQLTSLPGQVGAPTFSPDGTQIAFQFDSSVAVMDADGSGATELQGSGYIDGQPDFSPDGQRIVFAATYSAEETGTDIWIMDADGGDVPVALTQSGTQGLVNEAPAFSPDGKKIVFASNQQGSCCGLWTMNVDGSGQAPLTTPTSIDQEPNWGPAPSHATCAGKQVTIAGTGGPTVSPAPSRAT